jgi:hypothetical protein
MTRRAPAPPYRGEGPHALWHVSEDATITRFVPHRAATATSDEALVWAVDTRHLPLFWFPRDCARCTFWAGPRTTAVDAARFFDGRRDLRVHVVEKEWLGRIRGTLLSLYRLPADTFTEHAEVAGYWSSRATVEPVELITIGDLIQRHADAGIALRVQANLWPLWDEVVSSTVEFSGIRLANRQPK